MDSLRDFILNSLQYITRGNTLPGGIDSLLILVLILLIVVAFDLIGTLIARRLLPRVTSRMAIFRVSGKSMDRRIAMKMVRICSVAIFKTLFPLVLPPASMPWLPTVVSVLCSIYQTVLVVQLISLLLGISRSYMLTHESTRNHPLVNITQVLKLIVYCIGGIIIVSLLFRISVSSILTSLAAASAVLMLIFKDTILGFVAGIQLSSNDMVRVGDWITMNKYGVDGDVIDITLNTVKVRNFDMTVTTIPPYQMIADSFQNWRGMQEAGARRVKREIILDAQMIRTVDEDWVNCIRETDLDKEILERALKAENIGGDFGRVTVGKGDKFPKTNAGVYRRYIYEYLKSLDSVNSNFTLIVRLQPYSANGVPIELYFFANTTIWTEYESIQSNLMEYFIAIAGRFGLRLYQRVTNTELRPGEVLTTENSTEASN